MPIEDRSVFCSAQYMEPEERTNSLANEAARMFFLIVHTSKKFREVSMRMPLHGKAGSSLMLMGVFWMNRVVSQEFSEHLLLLRLLL